MDSQLANIQQNILCNDSYTLKRKGNEEQFKANVSVIDKLLHEADSHLTDFLSQNTLSAELTVLAKALVSEGIDILMSQAEIRIKLAPQNWGGILVFQEYEFYPLADDPGDEKCMYRVTAYATRKINPDPARFQRRPRPYRIQPSTLNSPPANQPITTQPSRKPRLCILCGRSGH